MALGENVKCEIWFVDCRIAKLHAAYLMKLKCNKGGLLFGGNYA